MRSYLRGVFDARVQQRVVVFRVCDVQRQTEPERSFHDLLKVLGQRRGRNKLFPDDFLHLFLLSSWIRHVYEHARSRVVVLVLFILQIRQTQ